MKTSTSEESKVKCLILGALEMVHASRLRQRLLSASGIKSFSRNMRAAIKTMSKHK